MPDVVYSTGSPGGGSSELPVIRWWPREVKNETNVSSTVWVSMAMVLPGEGNRKADHSDQRGPFPVADGVRGQAAAATDERRARAAAATCCGLTIMRSTIAPKANLFG
jgi:hypothetical protein